MPWCFLGIEDFFFSEQKYTYGEPWLWLVTNPFDSLREAIWCFQGIEDSFSLNRNTLMNSFEEMFMASIKFI